MSDNFNITSYLKKNGIGPYSAVKQVQKKKKQLKESVGGYVDLKPVGAGAPAGSYTSMKEADIYPKKPAADKIYAADEDDWVPTEPEDMEFPGHEEEWDWDEVYPHGDTKKDTEDDDSRNFAPDAKDFDLALERAEEILFRVDKQNFSNAVSSINTILTEDGFDEEFVRDYLIHIIGTII